IHAERNQDIEVERDETHWVGKDRKKNIDRHEHSFIGGIQTETVKLAKAETIGLAKALTTGLAYQVSVGTIEAHIAGMQMQVICGNSKIVLKPDAIHIESPQIHIKSGTKVHSDAPDDVLLNTGTAQPAPAQFPTPTAASSSASSDPGMGMVNNLVASNSAGNPFLDLKTLMSGVGGMAKDVVMNLLFKK